MESLKRNEERKQMTQKGIITAVICTCILLVADVLSTIRLGELVQYLEINPLYKHIGIVGIVIWNILFFGLLFSLYQYTSKTRLRFILMHGFTTMIVLRVFVVINNIRIGMNPPTVEAAMQVTTAVKTQYAMTFFAPFIVPFFIAILTFYLYHWDHNIEVKKDGKE